MKIQRKLNVVLVVLIVILLALASFGGIYYKNKNEMANRIPQFIMGTDLKGYRQVTLSVQEDTDSSTSTEENSTETENTTEANEASSEESKNETSSNNAQDNQNNEEKDNSDKQSDYKKSADIYRARLKSLKVDNYSVSCDENNGKIIITLPEDERTDIILADITQQGKFTIKDSETNEELLSNGDVRTVKVGQQEISSGTQMYMSIYFTTKGTSKFKNITKTYQNTVENTTETQNSAEEVSIENNTEESSNETANETEATTTENETTSSSEESAENKQIVLAIDDTTMMTTNFSEIIDNGVLSLVLGGSSTSSQGTSKDELYSAYNLAAIIENDALPVKYKVDGNTYISSAIETNNIKTIVYAEIVIALVLALIMIAKYRMNGILASLLSIGYLAILLIVIRYANVTISTEGLFAIELSYIFNIIYDFMICELMKEKDVTKKEKARRFKELIKKYSLILVPELIIAIVCCFTQWSQLLSFGMIIFWGILISWIYNTVISKILY